MMTMEVYGGNRMFRQQGELKAGRAGAEELIEGVVAANSPGTPRCVTRELL
jgi:hypothetical protein